MAMAAAVILTLMTMGLSTMGDGSLYRERCDECSRFPCALSGVLRRQVARWCPLWTCT